MPPPPPVGRTNHQKGPGQPQRLGYHEQLEHDKRLDRNLAKYVTATTMPHPRDQRTRDPIKLEHGYRTEPDEQVRHNQHLGDRKDFTLDTQTPHDKKGKQYISELQEIINILKAKLEDLEKYAAEVRKQRIFFRNFRETHFGHGEDEDEDEDER
ncbi:MAG: hypothetical protein Q9161_009336 [Pseudevernia consocians]